LPEFEAEAAKTKQKQTQKEETLSPIAQALCERGITRAVAIDFEENFPAEHIREKIELHDNKKEIGEITQNAAGWLREAIVRDYKLSEGQLKKQTQLEQKKAQQEEQRTCEEKAKEIQEQRLLEALANFPASEQWLRERIVEHVKVREMTIKSVGGEPFTEAEIEQMYAKYQSQMPTTDAEKRAWLASNYSEYSLSAIIETLKEKQQRSLKEASEKATEPVLLNSIEDVLVEVARQRAEFEAQSDS
jgi:hypothetical protein